MPELPEVQTVVNTLTPHVTGRRVQRVVHLRADMVTPPDFDLAGALAGRTVLSVARRGKRIVFLLDNYNHFFIHLGMTGRLTVERAEAPIQPHTHLRLDIGEAKELRLCD